MIPVGRRETVAAALVGVLAFLPFIRGVASGASFYFRDLALYFLPLRRLALDGLRSGEVRLWNPYLHEGVPLSLPAVGYPLDLLQLLRPDEVGISLVLALHVPLAAVGFYALARGLLRATPVAAAGGALVYALGGFVLSTVNLYVYLEAAAWSPLVVLTLARVVSGEGRRAVAAAALALAVALSTTGVEIVAQAVAVGLVLGLRQRDGRRWLARAAGTLVLGALVAAPVLLLVASQVGGSARGQGFATHVVLAHSIHPFTLLQGLIAGLHGNLGNLADEWWGQNFFPRGFPYVLSLYIGPAAFGLALVGAGRRHSLRAPLVVLALVSLVLCLGRWAGLGPVVDALPGPGVLRYPVKAFYTVHLTLALLVSLGLSQLGSGDAPRGWTPLAATTGLLGGVLALAPAVPHLAPATTSTFAAAFFPPGFEPGIRAVLLSRILGDAALGGALALVVAVVAVLARAERLRHATLLVVALLGVDLLRTGSGLNPMVTGAFFEPSAEMVSSLSTYREGRVFTCPFPESARYRQARLAKGNAHEMWTFAVALESLTPGFNVPLGVPTALSPDLTMLVPSERVLPESRPRLPESPTPAAAAAAGRGPHGPECRSPAPPGATTAGAARDRTSGSPLGRGLRARGSPAPGACRLGGRPGAGCRRGGAASRRARLPRSRGCRGGGRAAGQRGPGQGRDGSIRERPARDRDPRFCGDLGGDPRRLGSRLECPGERCAGAGETGGWPPSRGGGARGPQRGGHELPPAWPLRKPGRQRPGARRLPRAPEATPPRRSSRDAADSVSPCPTAGGR